jgi:uncharacterized membrane-anchored protein YhcB (DUF1043 family)
MNKAKEITQRASERILARVKNERTVTTTEEFTEENKHLFDNTKGSEHVSGVYRFINAIYKNRIFNYGKRLMYEFMIPQPSKLHRLAMAVSEDSNAVTLEKPEDPRTKGLTDFTKINGTNYYEWAAKYGALVNEYPREDIYVTKTVSNSHVTTGNEFFSETVQIQLPEGYVTDRAELRFFAKHDESTNGELHAVGISFGNVNLHLGNRTKTSGDITETDLDNKSNGNYLLPAYKENMSLSYAIENYHTFSLALSIHLTLDRTKIVQWQKETFERIIEGYERQLDTYNQALAEKKASGAQMLDSNPLFYRQIEQMVLRKNCISYLLPNSSDRQFGQKMYSGDDITKFQVNLDKAMDDYSSFAKFMEQAFEWELMSYSFYPYYWANEEDWADMYKFDSNDAIFRNFMQAGMARVIVTVRPGFEDAVTHYMATGQIWNGGGTPVIGDDMYLSVVDELREPEYKIEESWETVLPTNLIALQRSGVAIDAEGLPVFENAEEAITGSNAE